LRLGLDELRQEALLITPLLEEVLSILCCLGFGRRIGRIELVRTFHHDRLLITDERGTDRVDEKLGISVLSAVVFGGQVLLVEHLEQDARGVVHVGHERDVALDAPRVLAAPDRSHPCEATGIPVGEHTLEVQRRMRVKDDLVV
jgi:hypothetical protein